MFILYSFWLQIIGIIIYLYVTKPVIPGLNAELVDLYASSSLHTHNDDYDYVSCDFILMFSI